MQMLLILLTEACRSQSQLWGENRIGNFCFRFDISWP